MNAGPSCLSQEMVVIFILKSCLAFLTNSALLGVYSSICEVWCRPFWYWFSCDSGSKALLGLALQTDCRPVTDACDGSNTGGWVTNTESEWSDNLGPLPWLLKHPHYLFSYLRYQGGIKGGRDRLTHLFVQQDRHKAAPWSHRPFTVPHSQAYSKLQFPSANADEIVQGFTVLGPFFFQFPISVFLFCRRPG